MSSSESHPPPRSPPPFLNWTAIQHLSATGAVPVPLPAPLAEDVDAFFHAAAAFFDLPTTAKVQAYPPAPASGTEHGYYRVEGEKEFLTFRRATPSAASATSTTSAPSMAPTLPSGSASAASEAAQLEALLGRLWHDLAHLLFRALADVGRAWGISDEAWRDVVTESLRLPEVVDGRSAPSLLRVFRYEPQSGVADPHCDLGLLTLCICRGEGLQVRAPPPVTEVARAEGDDTPNDEGEACLSLSGGWQPAAPTTLLVGDTLRVLSGNRVHAGRHRVVATPVGRASLVFALRPGIKGSLDLRPFGGEGAVEMKALWERIRRGRVNVNAAVEVREQQRAQRGSVKGIA